MSFEPHALLGVGGCFPVPENVGTAASGDKLGGQGCAGACLLFGGSKRGRVGKDAIKVDTDHLLQLLGVYISYTGPVP